MRIVWYHEYRKLQGDNMFRPTFLKAGLGIHCPVFLFYGQVDMLLPELVA
jgi:hypothetical protein